MPRIMAYYCNYQLEITEIFSCGQPKSIRTSMKVGEHYAMPEKSNTSREIEANAQIIIFMHHPSIYKQLLRMIASLCVNIYGIQSFNVCFGEHQ